MVFWCFFVLLVLLCCFGFVLCSFVSFLAPSHKSCGVFQVSVEGHWTYSWTYVLVLQVFLRLFNLDCRYPRDLLQPASKKKKNTYIKKKRTPTSWAVACEKGSIHRGFGSRPCLPIGNGYGQRDIVAECELSIARRSTQRQGWWQ